jgi:LysR family transcriptional regulator, chromosome initiation inhibitor
VVDDQEYTQDWLQKGDVLGCVTELAKPLRGCVAQALGSMRYRCVAAEPVAEQVRGLQRKKHASSSRRAASPSSAALLNVPALCFNAKDHLQDRFLQQLYGLRHANYPRHYVPAGDAYHAALLQGLGWGMQSDVQLKLQWPDALKSKQLLDLFPGVYVDIPLYWHHWSNESTQASRLTEAVLAAAKRHLLPP